jgi:4-hydroxy-4-methyl-2-oxoglutarate aldolase
MTGGNSSVEMLDGIPTAVVSDALVHLGIVPHVIRGVAPLSPFGPGARMIGRAVTMGYAPVTEPHPFYEAPYLPYNVIPECRPGDVIVVASQDAPVAIWGDNMARMAHAHGLAGAVVDAPARDVAGIRASGFTMFTKGATPESAIDYYEAVTLNEPIEVSGVAVSPGDIVVGDGDGVVVVPSGRVADVEWAIGQIEAAEAWMGKALAAGTAADDIYVELQRRFDAIGAR